MTKLGTPQLCTIVVEPTATERSTAIAQGLPELKDSQMP